MANDSIEQLVKDIAAIGERAKSILPEASVVLFALAGSIYAGSELNHLRRLAHLASRHAQDSMDEIISAEQPENLN